MAKKIKGYLKIQVPAGGAKPAPPIGPALGQRGLNIMEFCKAFNAKTQDMEADIPIPTIVTIFEDKSFTFVTKTPPTSYYLKKAAKLEKGSATSGHTLVGSVTMDQCREIAKQKLPDLNTNDVKRGAKIIAGSARSMGLEVQG